ncbi:MAG: hypothetical protein H6558_21685 [Lewinellaceae bacterium]|nr:hypothetical protein [Lewinellaceae bacterium]
MLGVGMVGAQQWIFGKSNIALELGVGVDINATIAKNVEDMRWRNINSDVFTAGIILSLGYAFRRR